MARVILNYLNVFELKSYLLDRLFIGIVGKFERESVSFKKKTKELIKESIKNSISIDDRNMQFNILSGGESGDLVIRINNLDVLGYFPKTGNKNTIYSFNNLITKISTCDNYEKGRRKFERLDTNITKYFATVSKYKNIFTLDKETYCILFQEDLKDFTSLFEYLSKVKIQLGSDINSPEETSNIIQSILKDVVLTLVKIVNYNYYFYKGNVLNNFIPSLFYIKKFDKALRNLTITSNFRPLVELLRKSTKIKINNKYIEFKPFTYYTNFFLQKADMFLSLQQNTWMHGDFHSRNIMLKKSLEESYDIKLIDLKQMNFLGDYLYDLGWLLSDIYGYSDILLHDLNLQDINCNDIQILYPLDNKFYNYRNKIEKFLANLIYDQIDNNIEVKKPRRIKLKYILCRLKVAESLSLLESIKIKHNISEATFLYVESLRRIYEAFNLAYDLHQKTLKKS